MDMRPLWRDLHSLFCKCVGMRERPLQTGHRPRGQVGIYLGPIWSDVFGIRQSGHFMLRLEDMRVLRVRTVVCCNKTFPFRAALPVVIGSPPGGEPPRASAPGESSGGVKDSVPEMSTSKDAPDADSKIATAGKITQH